MTKKLIAMRSGDDEITIMAEGLGKTFDVFGKNRRYVLRNVSFSCRRGEITGVIGPNGAGKTTLLRIVASLVRPTEGRISVLGRDVSANGGDVRSRIGFLSGESALYERLTGEENIMLAADLCGIDRSRARGTLARLGEVLGFGGIERKMARSLSTGEKQKIAIAATLVREPEILILDEATNGLDILSARHILRIVETAASEGRTILYSAHGMNEIERLSDRIMLIHSGSIAESGTVGEILERNGGSDLTECFLKITGYERKKNSDDLS